MHQPNTTVFSLTSGNYKGGQMKMEYEPEYLQYYTAPDTCRLLDSGFESVAYSAPNVSSCSHPGDMLPVEHFNTSSTLLFAYPQEPHYLGRYEEQRIGHWHQPKPDDLQYPSISTAVGSSGEEVPSDEDIPNPLAFDYHTSSPPETHGYLHSNSGVGINPQATRLHESTNSVVLQNSQDALSMESTTCASQYESDFNCELPSPYDSHTDCSSSPEQSPIVESLPSPERIITFYSLDQQHPMDDQNILEPTLQVLAREAVISATCTSHISSTKVTRKRGNSYVGKTAEEINVEDEELPYAQLIYKALMSVPSRRMVLGEIYDYFRKNIPRFNKSRQKGWQNSIRHNLSMNGAFLKEERPRQPGDDRKLRGYVWVLSPEAEVEGVKSTTRFRKVPSGRKKLTDQSCSVISKTRSSAPSRERTKGITLSPKQNRKRRARRTPSKEADSSPLPATESCYPINTISTPESVLSPMSEAQSTSTQSVADIHTHGEEIDPKIKQELFLSTSSSSSGTANAERTEEFYDTSLGKDFDLTTEGDGNIQTIVDDYLYIPVTDVTDDCGYSSLFSADQDESLLGEDSSTFNDEFAVVAGAYLHH